MNNTLSKIVMFAAGAVVGSVVTWKLVEAKYEQIAREEIRSIREMYEDSVEEEQTEEDEKSEYEDLIKGANYVSYAKEKLKEKEEEDVIEPYVITPDEFGEGDYPTESLDYYEGDGVLVDTFGDVIENINEVVGEDFASHFGEYEKDSVFVRNDAKEIDYEILRDYRSYSEVE